MPQIQRHSIYLQEFILCLTLGCVSYPPSRSIAGKRGSRDQIYVSSAEEPAGISFDIRGSYHVELFQFFLRVETLSCISMRKGWQGGNEERKT
ncbi:hypothetical protein AN958_02714 [Leucoagaricus sp. SymC.cos]|nr:hypothetical protein AN958_02714 [Leucoagaricus sp. SymC.cos]